MRGIPFFDCSWVSDYANEREFFYIGGFGQYMMINNITLFDTGIHLKNIMIALHEIEGIRNGSPSLFIDRHVSNNHQTIVIAIIEHMLHSSGFVQYDKFDSLHEYPSQLIHNTFKANWWVAMSWDDLNFNGEHRIHRGYPYLKHLLCSEKGNWIKFDVIHALYPNIEHFEWKFGSREGRDIDIIAQDLLIYLSQRNKRGRLNSIAFNIGEKRIECQWQFKKYEAQFNRIGFTLAHHKRLRSKNDFHLMIVNQNATFLRFP